MKPINYTSPVLKSDHTDNQNSQKSNKIIYNKKAESEFFVDNSALAGFTGERILYMAVRELIENSLDSCETFSILPEIKISLKTFDQSNDLWILSCEDNGTGITSEKLPTAVCSFLTSAKYMEKQQRGLFGVGLKMVAAFSTKDTDYPIKVWSKSLDEPSEYYFELRTDIGTNKPIVLLKKLLKGDDSYLKGSSGFKIEVILRARLMPITKNKIYDYVTQTSIVNPYAFITFETDDGTFSFDRRTSIMPTPAREILPHPSDMDLKTLKKAISKYSDQKIYLPKILCSSFQKLSYEKAKEIVSKSGIDIKNSGIDYSEHDLIKIVNICKKTKFQNPNTDHLSPIGHEILTIGMMSEYTIVSNKNIENSSIQNIIDDNSISAVSSNKETSDNVDYNVQKNPMYNATNSKSGFSVKVLKPVLTAYTSRTCVINNRPTIVESGLAYGGDINSFKLYRFANKIPLLYDEGSDVAREVVSEVEINKMGITKKQAKEQFSTQNKESKRDRIIEVLPIHIFFHICSTKIPYKTAGKESIASEGELKYYMKSCLSELYRKLSNQIRKELKLKEEENKLKLYKHYLPFIVDAISDSLNINNSKLHDSFSRIIENHIAKKSHLEGTALKGAHGTSFESNSVSEVGPSSPHMQKKDGISNKQYDRDLDTDDRNNNLVRSTELKVASSTSTSTSTLTSDASASLNNNNNDSRHDSYLNNSRVLKIDKHAKSPLFRQKPKEIRNNAKNKKRDTKRDNGDGSVDNKGKKNPNRKYSSLPQYPPKHSGIATNKKTKHADMPQPTLDIYNKRVNKGKRK
ncbi:MAG: DNA topoisomerase VI subunit B [Thermoproteota archaeon]|nr:DNA topoisomerase VI subunit B [Thermoproteota archaeon]